MIVIQLHSEVTSTDLQKRYAELAKQVAVHEASARKLNEDDVSLRTSPAELVVHGAAESIRDRRIMVMCDELRLRGLVGELHADCNSHLSDRCAKLFEELNAARCKIRDGLLKFGYLEPTQGAPVPGSFSPGMVESHPLVLSLRTRLDAVRSFCNDSAIAERHARETRELREKIELIRNRIISATS